MMQQQMMIRPQFPQQNPSQFAGHIPQQNNPRPNPIQHIPQNNPQMNQSRPNVIPNQLPTTSQIQGNPVIINPGQQHLVQRGMVQSQQPMNMGQQRPVQNMGQPQMGYNQPNNQPRVYHPGPGQQQYAQQNHLPTQNMYQQPHTNQGQFNYSNQMQSNQYPQQNRPSGNPMESVEKQFDKFMKLM